MKLNSHLILRVFALLMASHSSIAEIKTLHTNDLGSKNGSWIVSGQDPYFIFANDDNPRIPRQVELTFDFEDFAGVNFEIFWELDNEGFSEQQKTVFKWPEGAESATVDFELLAGLYMFDAGLISKFRIDPLLPENSEFSLNAKNYLSESKSASVAFKYPTRPDLVDVGIPAVGMNSMGVLNNRLQIFDGDPHLILDVSGSGLGEDSLLSFKMDPKEQPVKLFSYIEIFWATDSHGFNEQHKAFFLHPYRETSYLDLAARIASLGDSVESVHALRIDFQYPFETDFELRLSILPKSMATSRKLTTLRYTTDPYHIQTADIAHQTVMLAVNDFFTRVFGDWAFTILYMLMVCSGAVYLIQSGLLIKKS
jgi:hypothetical protein